MTVAEALRVADAGINPDADDYVTDLAVACSVLAEAYRALTLRVRRIDVERKEVTIKVDGAAFEHLKQAGRTV